MSPTLTWIATGLAFLVSAFCSVAEGALLSYSVSRLEQRLKEPKERARVERYLQQVDRYVFTAIVLNAISDVILVWVCTLGFIGRGAGYALFLSLLIVIVGAEVLPRAFAAFYAEPLLALVLPPIAIVDRVLLPITWPLRKVREMVERALTNGDGARRRADEIVDEIRSATIEGSREGVLNPEDVEMIESIIDFRDVEVRAIMTPRADMVAIDVTAPLADAVKIATERGHARIPVYEGSRDHVVGIIYAKDMLRRLGSSAPGGSASVPGAAGGPSPAGRDDGAIRALMRKPLYVPATKAVGDLLREFRERRIHIAVVLDEYGGTAGIATIEDVIEVIVGEIDDEYDQGEADHPAVKRIDAETTEVDARLKIADAQEKLGLELPQSADFETLGGFLFFQLGRIPKKGERLSFGGAEYTIIDADERRIRRVRVQRVASGAARP